MARASKKKTTAMVSEKKKSVAEITKALAEEIDAQGEALGVSGGSTIRIDNNTGSIRTPTGVPVDSLDVVIVDFNAFRTHYDTDYDEKNPSPPCCWAFAEPASLTPPGQRGNPHERIVPAPGVKDPIQVDGDTCGTCPMNVFGSGPRGSKGCNERYSLVVRVVGTETLATINVAVSSKAPFENYVRTLKDAHRLQPMQVVTTLTTEPVKNSHAFVFKTGGPNEDLEEDFDRRPAAQAMLKTDPFKRPEEEPKQAKKKRGARARARA